MAQQSLGVQGRPLVIEASQSHADTPHSVGLLCTSDQPNADPSMWKHRTLTGDRLPCSQWDSNPQSQEVSGRRRTLKTARPLGLASAKLNVYVFFILASHDFKNLRSELETAGGNLVHAHGFMTCYVKTLTSSMNRFFSVKHKVVLFCRFSFSSFIANSDICAKMTGSVVFVYIIQGHSRLL